MKLFSEFVFLSALCFAAAQVRLLFFRFTSGSGGGGKGAMAPSGPVKISQISHRKDGRQRRLHGFHASRPLPYPAAGSATEVSHVSLYAKEILHFVRLTCNFEE